MPPLHTIGLILATLCLTGCFDERSGVTDAGAADSGPDDDFALRITCGETTCGATSSDVGWGAEPCCLRDGAQPCGLRSDQPLLSYAGMQIPVSSILERAAQDGQDIANTHPTIDCMPRDQPGNPDAQCPSAPLQLPGGPDAGPAPSYEVAGCCRPDGLCGYLDPTTDFGCVRISYSLLGKALGQPDSVCE